MLLRPRRQATCEFRMACCLLSVECARSSGGAPPPDVLPNAVGLGVCAVTLLNVLVLTPPSKRALPIHACICLGLVFQIVRQVTDMVVEVLREFLTTRAHAHVYHWPER